MFKIYGKPALLVIIETLKNPLPEKIRDNDWNLCLKNDFCKIYCVFDTDAAFKAKLSLPLCNIINFNNWTIDDDLLLSSFINLSELPDNLSVKGRLNLSGCTALTQLPENLSVGGLGLFRCADLIQPKNMKIGDRIYY